MRIGFDAKRLYNNFTGLGNYSRSLLSNLLTEYPEDSYFLYTPKVKEESLSRLSDRFAKCETRLPDGGLGAYWRSFSIVNDFARDQLDIYHGLSNELPFTIAKSKVPSVVTIHDVIFRKLPKTYPFLDRQIYSKCPL